MKKKGEAILTCRTTVELKNKLVKIAKLNHLSINEIIHLVMTDFADKHIGSFLKIEVSGGK